MRSWRRDGPGVRADHTLTLWGATFLRRHYRLRLRQAATVTQPSSRRDTLVRPSS